MRAGDVGKTAVGTRRVLTWKMVEGVNTVKARLVARGFHGPNLKIGIVNTSGCVSLRSSHLQVTSLSAIKKWRRRHLDFREAFFQGDGIKRDVCRMPLQHGDPAAYGVFGNRMRQRMV